MRQMRSLISSKPHESTLQSSELAQNMYKKAAKA